jgi:hypothetical protein
MPLLDHFHPPVSEERHWESFHTAWAAEIMGWLNEGRLPAGYFAETQIHIGGRVEIDVASLQKADAGQADGESNGGVATLTETGVLVMPAVFPDEIEIQVFRQSGGATLVGAIELVSPGNKDRPEARRAFAAKCASYLQAGLGLLVVDVVSERHVNLHDDLIDLLKQANDYRFPLKSLLYAVSYRPFRTGAEGDQIEIRPAALTIAQPLPTMPLALRGGPVIPIELESTYMKTRRRTLL